MKILLTTAVAAMALTSVGVSSASAAAAIPSSSTVKLTTTGVTLKKEGTEPKTCTSKQIELLFSGSGFIGSNGGFGGRTELTCDGGSLLYMRVSGSAFWSETAGYYLQIGSWNEGFKSPYGEYFQSSQNWPWVNGSEATPSTVTLNEVTIGWTTGGQRITMSGTFTAKSGSGGLVTMSH